VNDLGLYDDCAAKLDRDLIRERSWDYSVMANGVVPEDREKLRRQVVAQFGESLELMAPSKQRPSRKRKKSKRKGR
jgi:hypothetical protein